MNWHARMIYPYTEGSNATGHYDLQLEGTYTFDGVTYTNPVFSYNRDSNDEDVGYLAVFDKSLTTAIYKGYLPFRGYHYNETSSSTNAEYQAFLTLIDGSIDYGSKTRKNVKNSNGTVIGKMTRYDLTSSYKNYSKSSRNCFKALGLWVSALGDDRFTNFANNHPYTDYTAYKMANTPAYATLWDLQDTYTSY